AAIIFLLVILGFITWIMIYFIVGTSTNNYFIGHRTEDGGFSLIIIMIIVYAFIGVIVGIYLSVGILKKIMTHHAEKLWLRQKAQKYIVKDFQGRRYELEKYKRIYQKSNTTLIMNTNNDIH